MANRQETLDEIQVEIRDLFLAAYRDTLTYIPRLNDGASEIDLIEAVTLEALGQPKNPIRVWEEADESAVPQAVAVSCLPA